MEQINLYGKIIDGKLELDNKKILNQWIKTIPEGENIVVKFNLSKNYKSLRQLRLVYSMFRKLSDKLGYSVEEIKTLMKLKQGLCGYSSIEGEQIHFCKSISDMTKKELSEFIFKMDVWSNQNIGLPLLTYDDLQFLKS